MAVMFPEKDTMRPAGLKALLVMIGTAPVLALIIFIIIAILPSSR